MLVKEIISTIFNLSGYELRKRRKKGDRILWPTQSIMSQVSYESDEDFHRLYKRAQENTTGAAVYDMSQQTGYSDGAVCC